MKSNNERTVDALEVVENSGVNSGQGLIPQPHGGALLPGGMSGNKGSTGRPREELREMFRLSAESGIEELVKILDAPREVTIKCKCGEVHKVNPPASDTGSSSAGDRRLDALSSSSNERASEFYRARRCAKRVTGVRVMRPTMPR